MKVYGLWIDEGVWAVGRGKIVFSKQYRGN